MVAKIKFKKQRTLILNLLQINEEKYDSLRATTKAPLSEQAVQIEKSR